MKRSSYAIYSAMLQKKYTLPQGELTINSQADGVKLDFDHYATGAQYKLVMTNKQLENALPMFASFDCCIALIMSQPIGVTSWGAPGDPGPCDHQISIEWVMIIGTARRPISLFLREKAHEHADLVAASNNGRVAIRKLAALEAKMDAYEKKSRGDCLGAYFVATYAIIIAINAHGKYTLACAANALVVAIISFMFVMAVSYLVERAWPTVYRWIPTLRWLTSA